MYPSIDTIKKLNRSQKAANTAPIFFIKKPGVPKVDIKFFSRVPTKDMIDGETKNGVLALYAVILEFERFESGQRPGKDRITVKQTHQVYTRTTLTGMSDAEGDQTASCKE